METNAFSSGFTPKGQLYLQVKTPAGMLMKTTKSPLTFLRMLFSLPEDQEKETRRQDSLSHDHQYECCVCHGGFVTGGGAVIADELFCTPCLKQYNHYARFLDLGLTGGFIHYLTEYRMRYL